jgi:uncharacterized protein (DUF433 family)
MARTFEPLPVPLHEDEDGNIRVGGYRVTLDTVIGRYQEGDSPEEIAANFAPVELADIYATIAYYLTHKAELDAYMKEGDRIAAEWRALAEAKPSYQAYVARLKAKLAERHAVDAATGR